MRRVLALIALTLAPGFALATDLSRSRDGHMAPPFDTGVRPNIEAQRIPEPVRPKPVLLRSPRPLQELGTFDARASAECRKRDFGQFEQHRATVVLAGQTYGAARAGSDDLADSRKIAQAGTLYVFEHQSMTNCRVWRVRAR